MCTAIFDNRCGALFGRTLDLEYSLGEEVVICPKKYPLPLRHAESFDGKFAILGACILREGFPLFYDGLNEAGVAAAALNFPISAEYADFDKGKLNLASFELIPYLLGTCESLAEVRERLKKLNVTSVGFSSELLPTPLHWIFADKGGSLVVECTAGGLNVHENPVGVLTNEPSFDFQLLRLADYSSLDSAPPKNNLSADFQPKNYSRGLGAFGLPGDFSSSSRFVRATFVKNHTSADGADGVTRFFHIMDSVAVPRGCVITEDGREVETVYTSCMALDEPTYYFKTYSRAKVHAVSLCAAKLLSGEFVRLSMDEDVSETDRAR